MAEANDTHPDQRERDQKTVALLLAGETEGLERLFVDHGALLRTYLRRNFGKMLDESELDEVMSLASIRVWRGAAMFDTKRGSLRSWLAVIASNCARRLLEQRRRSLHEPRADIDFLLLLPTDATSEQSKQRRRLISDMYRCLEQLPPMQRAVLYADLEAGGIVPATALAQRLGTSANSIYVSRLRGHRALEHALRRLGHYRPPDEEAPEATGIDDLEQESES